jgi:hypothetical protein
MRAHHRRLLASAVALCAAIAFPAASQGPEEHHVAGEKLDSGLAQLPHYRDWGKYPETRHLVVRPNRVAGEKLDSGLGELKPYRYWADGTGRVRETVEMASRH